MGPKDFTSLISARLALCRYENQPPSALFGSRLGRLAANFQDAEYGRISGEHTDANGESNCEAENERHKQRDHNEPSPVRTNKDAAIRCRRAQFRICGFFNLPALTPTAIDN